MGVVEHLGRVRTCGTHVTASDFVEFTFQVVQALVLACWTVVALVRFRASELPRPASLAVNRLWGRQRYRIFVLLVTYPGGFPVELLDPGILFSIAHAVGYHIVRFQACWFLLA